MKPFSLFCCFSILFLSTVTSNFARDFVPTAERGKLDLQNWNWENQGAIDLKGQWEFYWQEFLTPESFQQDSPSLEAKNSKNYIQVPGVWNGTTHNENILGGDGFATYRLRVKLPSSLTHKKLALKIKEIRTAYTIFVNGEMLAQNGILGESQSTTVPKYRVRLVRLKAPQNQLDIVVQVSNFHHKQGGFFQALSLAPERYLSESREYLLAQDLFFFGAVFITGLSHLGLFFLIRRRDRLPLYFAGVCFVAAIRSLSQGEGYLVEMFPQMNWETFMGFSYLTFYPAVLFLSLYVHSLFPVEYGKRFLWVTVGICLIFSAVVLVTPAEIYTHTLQIFQIFTLFVIVHALYVMVRAAWNDRENAFIFIAGFLILFATVIHDYLFFNGILHTRHIAVFGMFAMIFSQSFLVYRRFALLFFKVEELSEELDIKNQRLIQFEKIKEQFTQLELSQVRQRLFEMLNTLDEGIISLDSSAEVTYTNRKAEEMLGYDSEKMLGLKVDILFPQLHKDIPHFDSIAEWEEEEFTQLSRNPLRINGKRSDRSTVPIRVHFRKLELEEDEYSLVLTHSVEDSKIKQLSFLKQNSGKQLNENKTGKDFRKQLVYVLQLSLENWEKSTEKNRVRFAQESKLWKVQMDQGTPRVRTMEKYLQLQSLPRRPHWKKVFLTANYVLDHCPLLPSHRKNLEQAIDELIRLSQKDS